MYSNRKAAVLTTLAGVVFLITAFFLGLIMIGIICFPIIWGLTYKVIEKICFAKVK